MVEIVGANQLIKIIPVMKYILPLVFLCFIGCKTPKHEKKSKNQPIENTERPILTLEQANRVVALPAKCINTEYPNRLGQTLGSAKDIKSPKELHPAFYGCFDWHSSVHGHWTIVALLRKFPNLENAEALKMQLLINLSKENIAKEIDYFSKEYNKSFERTYGWAWLLKLAIEVHQWDDPMAKTISANIQPLTDLIVKKYMEYLPKLTHPIRVGEHQNTAFGLTFAWDWAKMFGNKDFEKLIKKRAKEFYLKDAHCPLSWEPSGYDFISPCLQEAELMKRVLIPSQFRLWIADFLPQLKNPKFNLEVVKVSDRTDGKLVHLDGLNFSRAWALLRLSEHMPEYLHLKPLAYKHINTSLPNIVDDSYEGGHWLGSFAVYALTAVEHRN